MVNTRTPISVFLVACILSLAFPVQAKVVDLSSDFEQPVSSGTGGRSLLVEEITATWCPTCAEVDPELTQVADSHGSRIAMIALHPSDGEDAFQPPAAKHRLERHRLANDALVNYSTPTFVVEGGEPRIGYDAWQDVQKDILNTELIRQEVSELAFTVERTEVGYRATVTQANLINKEEAQLTFMVIEHHKNMPEGAFNPGGPSRDRVLVASAACDLSSNTIISSIDLLSSSAPSTCADSFTVEFQPYASWSVILVHEQVNESIDEGERLMSYGAVELAFRERATQEPISSLGPWLIGLAVVLAISSIIRKK